MRVCLCCRRGLVELDVQHSQGPYVDAESPSYSHVCSAGGSPLGVSWPLNFYSPGRWHAGSSHPDKSAGLVSRWPHTHDPSVSHGQVHPAVAAPSDGDPEPSAKPHPDCCGWAIGQPMASKKAIGQQPPIAQTILPNANHTADFNRRCCSLISGIFTDISAPILNRIFIHPPSVTCSLAHIFIHHFTHIFTQGHCLVAEWQGHLHGRFYRHFHLHLYSDLCSVFRTPPIFGRFMHTFGRIFALHFHQCLHLHLQ